MSGRVRPCSSVGCSICILAGGLSNRMGREKGRMRLGRRSLLGHVRRVAEGLGVPVRIIRKDLVPRCGPLGGIYTGLKTSAHEAEVFLSCDMPFVTAELLRKVMRAKAPVFMEHNGRAGPAKAGTTYSAGRVGFPFMLAVADVAAVENEIRAGRLSLQNLAKRLKARRLRLGSREGRQLFNVNTSADWAEALKRRAELPL